MSASLDGKVCLVTGASRGIGAAIAVAMASEGARVVVHYGHNKDLAEQVAEGLDGDGHLVLGTDLADPAGCVGIGEGRALGEADPARGCAGSCSAMLIWSPSTWSACVWSCQT